MQIKRQTVFDVFIDGEYYRTFSNDIQVNEITKRLLERNPLCIIEVMQEERDYVEFI
jgi:hypothetical protein